MRWLGQWQWKDGPGIPKGLPKRTGLPLFAEILVREWWELIKLNLLIVLFSLPLVTLPTAHAAGMRVAIRMVRDQDVYLWREFWAGFRTLLLPATIYGLAGGMALGLGIYATFVYGQLAAENPLFSAMLTVCFAATTFVAVTLVHLFVLLAATGERGVGLIRLALLATLLRPLPVLASLLFIAVLWLIHIALYPVSVFMPAVFNFSLGVLATTFAGLGATEFVIALRGRRHKDETEETSAAGRSQADTRELTNE